VLLEQGADAPSLLPLHKAYTDGDVTVLPDLDGMRVVRIVVHRMQAQQVPGAMRATTSG
jgi:hypothetical protein